jgi:hypothetical protein
MSEPSERVREAAVIVRDYLAWRAADAVRAGDIELASSLCKEPVYSAIDRLAAPQPLTDDELEIAAAAAFHAMQSGLPEFLRVPPMRWEAESEKLREEWRASTRAALQAVENGALARQPHDPAENHHTNEAGPEEPR